MMPKDSAISDFDEKFDIGPLKSNKSLMFFFDRSSMFMLLLMRFVSESSSRAAPTMTAPLSDSSTRSN
ncbi:hypothetical protein D3C84_984160 [compost metagenome]